MSIHMHATSKKPKPINEGSQCVSMAQRAIFARLYHDSHTRVELGDLSAGFDLPARERKCRVTKFEWDEK